MHLHVCKEYLKINVLLYHKKLSVARMPGAFGGCPSSPLGGHFLCDHPTLKTNKSVTKMQCSLWMGWVNRAPCVCPSDCLPDPVSRPGQLPDPELAFFQLPSSMTDITCEAPPTALRFSFQVWWPSSSGRIRVHILHMKKLPKGVQLLSRELALRPLSLSVLRLISPGRIP